MQGFWEVEQFIWRPTVRGNKEGVVPQPRQEQKEIKVQVSHALQSNTIIPLLNIILMYTYA